MNNANEIILAAPARSPKARPLYLRHLLTWLAVFSVAMTALWAWERTTAVALRRGLERSEALLQRGIHFSSYELPIPIRKRFLIEKVTNSIFHISGRPNQRFFFGLGGTSHWSCLEPGSEFATLDVLVFNTPLYNDSHGKEVTILELWNVEQVVVERGTNAKGRPVFVVKMPPGFVASVTFCQGANVQGVSADPGIRLTESGRGQSALPWLRKLLEEHTELIKNNQKDYHRELEADVLCLDKTHAFLEASERLQASLQHLHKLDKPE